MRTHKTLSPAARESKLTRIVLSGIAITGIAVLFLLPVIGVMLNGTSSVLYGTVPEMSAPEHTERAFAIFYTGTIASGAISPVLYGFLGDRIGVHGATYATALTAVAIFPLALALRPHLANDSTGRTP